MLCEYSPDVFLKSEFSPGEMMLSLSDLVRDQAENNKQASALLAPGRLPLSYAKLYRQIAGVVDTLNQSGLGWGDRVAIVLPNGPEMAVAFLAVASAMTSAPLNPDYSTAEFDFYLTTLQAQALIISAGTDSPAIKAAQSRGISIIELTPLLNEEAGMFRLAAPRGGLGTSSTGFAPANDVALLLHTSGTTARPKIVPLTQANLCTSAANIKQTLQLWPEDRCLNIMPLFHVHGLVAALLASLAAGGSVVCTPGFHAPSLFAWFNEFRPTWYTAVPAMHQSLLAYAERSQVAVPSGSLRFIRSCSAALPPQIGRKLQAVFGSPVIEAYGMTEAAHQIASNPLPPAKQKAGSVGLATGLSVAILDDAGNQVPPTVSGEIVLRGDNVISGYLENPSANETAFSNGWFRTGDLGHLDHEGYLYLTGRLREVINRGGEKISPREVDEVLLNHPTVAEALTFAIPHPTLGEDVAAAVTLREGARVNEIDLRMFAAQTLAHFKVPTRIVFIDEIPKGPTGKPQRVGLAGKLGLIGSARNAEGAVYGTAYVGPRTPLEESVAAIWAESLGLESIGVHDHFLDLGGDSVSATKITGRIVASFRAPFTIVQLFNAPTIAGQSLLITLAQAEQAAERDPQALERMLTELEALTDEQARQLRSNEHISKTGRSDSK
jgi:acyl-CoA synthetase (AMP-forming)/AMP-acid ligase II